MHHIVALSIASGDPSSRHRLSPRAVRTWQKERIDRNARASDVSRLHAQIAELNQPRFLPEITDVFIDNDHQRTGWINIYVYLVIRNQGADSAIDRWKLIVVPPQSASPFIQTEKGLSEWLQGHDGAMHGNLLHDREIIKRAVRKGVGFFAKGRRPVLDSRQDNGQR